MFLSLQVVKGLLYLWELKIMHRGEQGLTLFEFVLVKNSFLNYEFIQSLKTTVVFI